MLTRWRERHEPTATTPPPAPGFLPDRCAAKPPRRPKAGGVGLSDLLDALKRRLATASVHPYQVCTCQMRLLGSLLPELLREPDENSFGAPDVAEPINVFVLDYFADELRAAFAETGERIVDVLHGEHDA